MKNLYLLPTDKPSRLYKHNELGFKLLAPIQHEIGAYNGYNQNIYITSNEEIKEGDWFHLDMSDNDRPDEIHQMGTNKRSKTGGINFSEPNSWTKSCKKIILTTDQDLIADGVQAIDDEFLEWFVKNPTCEEVDVNDWLDTNGNIAWGGDKRYQICNLLYDKIIIPQEEPKQETLEQAAESFVNNTRLRNYKVLFIEGAKWMQERMYSEEEVKQITSKLFYSMTNSEFGIKHTYESFEKWFEQNIKK